MQINEPKILTRIFAATTIAINREVLGYGKQGNDRINGCQIGRATISDELGAGAHRRGDGFAKSIAGIL